MTTIAANIKPAYGVQVAANVRAELAEFEAIATDKRGNDVILAWSNGLGVGFRDDGSAFAVGLLGAHALVGVTRDHAARGVVTNGNMERAQRMTRAAAIALHLPTIRRLLADLEEAGY